MYQDELKKMKADCANCSGLCCVALFFSKMDGFPENKQAGTPCKFLLNNNQCDIHEQLASKKMLGCIGYDCFGAGQYLTQDLYHGKTWRDKLSLKDEIFDVFMIIFQLYQMRYFLLEASRLNNNENILNLLDENKQICHLTPKELLVFDMLTYKHKVTVVLKEICSKKQQVKTEFLGKCFKNKNMSGLDLSMKLLIAVDFSGCQFNETIFLGADMRNANLKNADLSKALFLTQGQVNSALGNKQTKIPNHLEYPVTWL